MFLKGSKPPSKTLSGGPNRAAPPPPGAPSIISPDLKIVGDLSSVGDVQVDGTVEGDIRSRTLTIGEGAIVRGAVVAETVRVYGAVIGEIEADNVTLARTAKVEGDIAHRTLTMETGASLVGALRHLTAPLTAGDRNAKAGPEQDLGAGAGGPGSGGQTRSAAPSPSGAHAAGRYGI